MFGCRTWANRNGIKATTYILIPGRYVASIEVHANKMSMAHILTFPWTYDRSVLHMILAKYHLLMLGLEPVWMFYPITWKTSSQID